MENVTLNQKEQARLKVLNSLLAEQMTVDQAAGMMGVSPHRTRRILAAYRKEGVAALAHGHRGRRPLNANHRSLEPIQSAKLHSPRKWCWNSGADGN